MPDIWDDNIRNTTNTGDLYAYAFGVAHGIFINLRHGNHDRIEACDRFDQLRQDVEARVEQMEQAGREALQLTEQHQARPLFVVPKEPVTAIYVTDENAGDQ